VKLQATVASSNGDTFYINDGSGEAKVYVKASTGIDKPKTKKGDSVSITGVVSETSSGYRVLPRTLADISVGDPSVLGASVVSVPTGSSLLVALLSGLAVAGAVIVWRKTKTKMGEAL